MMRILVALVLFAAPFAHAQLFARELTLSMSPEYPAPGETVRLSIQTHALDLPRSQVIWYVNKREVGRGFGLSEITAQLGAAGSATEIRVVAEDIEGLIATSETVIRPTEVDLLWEATSYVPPFYEGRPLPGGSTPIRAQAVARLRASGGALIPERDIVYTWYRNNTIVSSGRGKSSALLPGPLLFGADSIRVTVESADRTLKGAAQTRIVAVEPFLSFHEDHPLFGVLYHRSLEGSVNTLETELDVTAVPYFADITSPSDQALIYEWKMNDYTITADPVDPQTLALAANGYRGAVNVTLALTSARDIAMRAVGSWTLVFGAADTGFFGQNPFGGSE